MAGGCITKRGDGYRARWDGPVDPRTGKRRQWSHQCATRREAREWIAAQQHHAATGTYLEPASLTVQDYLAEWLAVMATRNVRPSTLARYRTVITNHLTPHLGTVRLQQLQPLHMTRFMVALAPLAPAYQRDIYRTLRQALGEAVDLGLMRDNVAKRVRGPRGVSTAMHCWTSDQARAFLAAAEGTPWAIIWHLALGMGLRRGELQGARWADVDLEAGVLHIRQSACYGAGGWTFGPPKTASSRRALDIPAALAGRLRLHRIAQLQVRMAHGPLWHDHDLVVADPVGKPLWSSYYTAAIRETAARAGVPAIRLHDQRHTFATLALQRGMPLHIVSRYLGHTDPAMTIRVYAHVLPHDGKALAALICDVLYG